MLTKEARDKYSAAYLIFHHFYECLIPQFHLFSEEEIKMFGIPATGDPIIDKGNANRLSSARLTISQMAEIYSQGSSIVLQKPEESLEICEIIFQHLTDWMNHSQKGLGGLNPPIEELKQLEHLARDLESKAMHYANVEQTQINRALNQTNDLHFKEPPQRIMEKIKQTEHFKQEKINNPLPNKDTSILDKALETPVKETKEKNKTFITDMLDKQKFQTGHWR